MGSLQQVREQRRTLEENLFRSLQDRGKYQRNLGQYAMDGEQRPWYAHKLDEFLYPKRDGGNDGLIEELPHRWKLWDFYRQTMLGGVAQDGDRPAEYEDTARLDYDILLTLHERTWSYGRRIAEGKKERDFELPARIRNTRSPREAKELLRDRHQEENVLREVGQKANELGLDAQHLYHCFQQLIDFTLDAEIAYLRTEGYASQPGYPSSE